MHARVTTFEATDIAGIEAQLDVLAEKTAAIPGLVRSNVVWGDDGKGVLMAIYESAEAATAGQAHALQIWGSIITLLTGMPESIEYAKVRMMK